MLDARARAAASGFAGMEPAVVDRVAAAVARNFDSGARDECFGHLRHLEKFEAGVRLVVAR